MLLRKLRLVLILGSVFFCGYFVAGIIKGIRGSDNMGNIMLRNKLYQANDTHTPVVAIVSPWNTRTELHRGGDGVWRIPKGEKRVVARIVASVGTSEKIEDDGWLVSSTLDQAPIWEAAKIDIVGDETEITRVNQSVTGSILPSKEKVINWMGDGRLLLSSFGGGAFGALHSCLAFAMLSWAWRMAAE